jgi:hypothetical protein
MSPLARRTFTVDLERVQKTATMFRVPFDLREAFGRARPAVKVTIRGYTWRTTPGVYSEREAADAASPGKRLNRRGVGHVVVNRATKDATGVDAGDRVRVTMELDEEPRTVDLPGDLQVALEAMEGATEAFAHLSFTHGREYVQWVEDAKRPETRSRRVAETVKRVRAGMTPP